MADDNGLLNRKGRNTFIGSNPIFSASYSTVAEWSNAAACKAVYS